MDPVENLQTETPKHEWRRRLAIVLVPLFGDEALTTRDIMAALEQPRNPSRGHFALATHRVYTKLSILPWTELPVNAIADRVVEQWPSTEWVDEVVADGPFVNFKLDKTRVMSGMLRAVVKMFPLPVTVAPQPAPPSSKDPNPEINCYYSIDLPDLPQLYEPHHTRALLLAATLQRCRDATNSICNADPVVSETRHVVLPLMTSFGDLALALRKTDGVMGQPLVEAFLEIRDDPEQVLASRQLRHQLESKDPSAEIRQMYARLQTWVTAEQERVIVRRFGLLEWRDKRVVMDAPWALVSRLQDMLTEALGDRFVRSRGKQVNGMANGVKMSRNDDDAGEENEAWHVDLSAHGLGVAVLKDDDGLLTTTGMLLLHLVLPQRAAQEHQFIGAQSAKRPVQQANCLFRQIMSSKDAKKGASMPEFTFVEFMVAPITKRKELDASARDVSMFVPCLPAQMDALREQMQEIMRDNQGTVKYASLTTHFEQESKVLGVSTVQLAQQHADRLARATILIHHLIQRRCKPVHGHCNVQISGNSGVFLLYVHARICGIQRYLAKHAPFNDIHEHNDSDQENHNENSPFPQFDCQKCLDAALAKLDRLETSQEAFDLIDLLQQCHAILGQVMATRDPHPFVSYLFKIARLTNQTLYNLRVKSIPTDLALPRWLLFWSVKLVLEHGFHLVCIEPEKK
ncbi:hypothetical protein BC940DRAFT_310028 [Gongronella butleri]|nr:hypothetical protein BC940DRAFT_310028 [Gongronella butleri]